MSRATRVETTMQFGIHRPHLGHNFGGEPPIDFPCAVEAAENASGWLSDHVCWPPHIESKYPYSGDGSFAPIPHMGCMDPIGTEFFVAGATSTLRLGCTVLILPYRQPVVTAKQFATPSRSAERGEFVVSSE